MRYTALHGYIASEYVEQPKTVGTINIATRGCKKYIKEMSINNQKIEARIDTGNDIVMRADILDWVLWN
jgi:predicted aspartyl protease